MSLRTDKKKKKLKLDSRFFARLLVLILSLSMLVGVFYYVLLFSQIDSQAVQPSENPVNPIMRIAIFYDEKISVDVNLTSESGFRVGYTGENKEFTEITTLPNRALYVARNVDLYYNGARYVHATEQSGVTVGRYHIYVPSDHNYAEDIELIKEVFPEYNVFPANIDQQFYVVIGQFVKEEEAQNAFQLIKDTLVPEPKEEETTDKTTSEDVTDEESTDSNTSDGVTSDEITTDEITSDDVTSEEVTTEEMTTEPEVDDGPLPQDLTSAILSATVSSARDDSEILIDPTTHKIVWAFAHNNATEKRILGVGARDNGSRLWIMRCYHGASNATRVYNGIFECAPVSSGSFKGIRVINLVPLEDYIVGVTSAEINVYWPLETLKAFTIAVRNYSIRSFNRHSGNAADLCNESHCQVFNGYGPANDRAWRAAEETADIIAISQYGNLCGTFYSSSTGGCTANVTDVWGSSLATYPYLKAVATPWEKYYESSKGEKISTVSGSALYDRLVEKGYTGLKGAVTEIKITKTGNNSTYVTQIQFFDAKGNVVTVNRADKIKTLLSSYVNSANFVVTKSGQDVVRTNYTMLGFGGVNNNTASGLTVLGNPNLYKVLGRQLFSVFTASGSKTFYDSDKVTVLTANGEKTYNMTGELDSQYYPTIIGVGGQLLPDISQLTPIVTTETLSTVAKDGCFTFISRGWGHGVGMSQYGIRDLGNLGYDYQTILRTYYSGIQYITYYDYLH